MSAEPADRHAPAYHIPKPESVFELVRDRYGQRLAIVLGNHAAGGFCPYYTQDRCLHCDIGAGEGVAFDLAMNHRRLAWFREFYRAYLDTLNHLVLYNSGSVLNPREMPVPLLDEIVPWACSLPAMRVISLDSREPFIKAGTLTRLIATVANAAARPIVIRPILGIESSDDHIRNEVLQKAMPQSAVERAFRVLKEVSAESGPQCIGLDANIVIAGPGTTSDTAVVDAVTTARDVLNMAERHHIAVDLNLHPYYPGMRSSAVFPHHLRCSLKTTGLVAVQIAELVRSRNQGSAIFIGWNDEGHDRQRHERCDELALAREVFDRFNATNDPSYLNELVLSSPPASLS